MTNSDLNNDESTMKPITGLCGRLDLRNGEIQQKEVLDNTNINQLKVGASESENEALIEGQLLVERILKEAASVPVDNKQPFLLPAWFDRAKFLRGQRYFHANYFALFVSKLSGLLAILAVPSILNVLVLTGKSSEPMTAFRRYLDTLSHMTDWYQGDICNPNSKCRKSLLTIRGRHCCAARLSQTAGIGPITQRDMAVTQFGFMGFAIVAPEKLGVRGSDEDVEGFIHFWRVIGHLLGISDQYNLCRGNLESTRVACQRLLNEVLVPSIEHPVKEFDPMARALLNGMWAMVPTLQVDAFLDFTRSLCCLPKTQEPRTLYSRIIFSTQIFVHTVLLYYTILLVVFRPLLNFHMWLSVFITQRFPFLAFMAFGRNVMAPEMPHSLQPMMT